ncbi:cupin domain-containing protein [Paenibacillus crassostreae]|uniref:Cupin n=1 Tax=Paenibacillus crassostreae TaxID=1763538 RepID=A0A167FIT0_9BACL|nr:cupin domain-containing protein [Paenibacillus crassostreae]AOZ94362.1 cupin [Paenibacillus crassostreae]OAB76601.1 cupin [Paenibacillus crassostreae]
MEKKELQPVKEYNENKFTKRILFKSSESVVFVLNFMPGQELPKHQHPGSELFVLVTDGSGIVTINGEDTLLVKDDVISCEGEEHFSFKNTGDTPTSLYAVLSKIPSEDYAQKI